MDFDVPPILKPFLIVRPFPNCFYFDAPMMLSIDASGIYFKHLHVTIVKHQSYNFPLLAH